MLATEPLTMYGTPAVSSGAVKRRKSSAPSIKEELRDPGFDAFFTPTRVLHAQPGGFQLASGLVELAD